jgi:tRNA(Arg) A34 adenosine deaminase TadA
MRCSMESWPLTWDGLSSSWKTAFSLAWESLQAGSPPIGAVVVDRDDRVVSRGRSRRHEATGPRGQLAGSRIAHAEINALAGVPIEARGLTLLTTLESCLVCASAAAIARIEHVTFAGSDPTWRFLGALPARDESLARVWVETTGPADGPVGALATLLPIIELLARTPLPGNLEVFERAHPALVDYGRHLLNAGEYQMIVEGSIDDAANRLWPELASLSS